MNISTTSLPVFKKQFIYRILYPFVKLLHGIFYHKISVSGLENIPDGTPVLIAANHQNALMDALAVLFASPRPVGFMARADIFKKPAIAAILNMLKILPVYRIRDGFDSLDNNKEAFDQAIAVLQSGTPVCLLPEGSHLGEKRLRPLKKGIGRIAFQAQSAQLDPPLVVVPAGIDYSDYFHSGADLNVVFGQAIPIGQFMTQYANNPAIALNQFTRALTQGMKAVMLDLPEQDYALIHDLTRLEQAATKPAQNDPAANTLENLRNSAHRIITLLPQGSEQREIARIGLNHYKAVLKQHGFSPEKLGFRSPGGFSIKPLLFAILLSPLWMAGAIASFVPLSIARKLASSSRDPHFANSIRFGATILVYPLFIILTGIVLAMLPLPPMTIWMLWLAIPITGLVYFRLKRTLHTASISVRLSCLRIFRPLYYQDMLTKYHQTLQTIQPTNKP